MTNAEAEYVYGKRKADPDEIQYRILVKPDGQPDFLSEIYTVESDAAGFLSRVNTMVAGHAVAELQSREWHTVKVVTIDGGQS